MRPTEKLSRLSCLSFGVSIVANLKLTATVRAPTGEREQVVAGEMPIAGPSEGHT